MQLQNGLTHSVPNFSQNTATTGVETLLVVKAQATDRTITPTFLIIPKSFGDYNHSSQSFKDNHQQKNLSHSLTQSHPQSVPRTSDTKPCQTGELLHPPLDQHLAVKWQPHTSPSGFCASTWQHERWNTIAPCCTNWYFLPSLHQTAFPADKEPHIITIFSLLKRASEETTTWRKKEVWHLGVCPHVILDWALQKM